MSALALDPEATYPEAIQGWRCWRVLPFKRLDGSETYRLCAVGTYGTPKVWQPGQATLAQCSDYESDHEAPWPSHECGIWALNDETRAFRRMVGFMQSQTGDKAGWAFGRVSLWGRVVEHEKGWRGQYAYPYAVRLEADDPTVGEALRRDYGLDVEWIGAPTWGKVRAKLARESDARTAEADDRLKKLREGLVDVQKQLREISGTASTHSTKPAPTRRYLPWRAGVDAFAQGLQAVLDQSGDCLASSRQVAEYMAEPQDSSLPLGPNEVVEAGCALHKAAVAGRVIQLRPGETGTSRWTLPGVTLSEEAVKAGYKPVVDRHADFDAECLQALKATLKATKQKSACVRDVLAHLGETDAHVSRKVRMSHAFGRAILRGELERAVGWPHRWALPSRGGA